VTVNETGELERLMTEVAARLFAPGSVAATLQRVVDLAVVTIEACDHAGILLVQEGEVVDVAINHEEEERRVEALGSALQARQVIGQAQGILIERERLTAEAAFDLLRRASQHLNVKLRDLAATLVDTGEVPPIGPPHR
jgi:AmiR/NasT family two-component response regulator